jgi:23S rRNA (cytidine2498-2'-O)-methyltransferase
VGDFTFATCLPGLEPAVKLEVARDRPALRFAYSRPGLVTFKADAPIASEDPPASVFARVWGKSIGKADDPAAAAALLAPFAPDRLHVFARDPDAGAELERWRAIAIPPGDARDDELVADVIVAPEGDAWIGIHRHDRDRAFGPGGTLGVELAADAPSRAYAKIEEAIAWARLPIAAGHTALEIGAAPGGAALALARRGVTVYGVDTGELAAIVRDHVHENGARVHHLAMKVGALRWEQLPAVIDWLLVDVNLAPRIALHELARLMRGAVITLKMNDAATIAELPERVARLHELGFSGVRLRHLPSNRQEICAVAAIARRT